MVEDDNENDRYDESANDSGDSYRPTKDDYNSFDSDNSENDTLEEIINKKLAKTNNGNKDNTRNLKRHKLDKRLPPKPAFSKKRRLLNKKPASTQSQQISKTNNKSSSSFDRPKEDNENRLNEQKNRSNTRDDNDILLAKQTSLLEKEIYDNERCSCEKRLDELLLLNGLDRIKVPGDGNCFFVSALCHISSIKTSLALRNVLCDHIVDNIDEYIGYLTNTHCCHSFEYDIACIDFRTEIEELRQEGNWTSQAGDLLPLALSNWSGQPVKIFSSLTTRPITTITPSLMLMDANPIFLSYIMSENGSLPEHYDGCLKIGTAGSLTADDKEKSSLAQNDINHNQESNFSVSAILQTTNDSINKPACSHIESDIAVDVELEESLLEELFESQHNISSMEEDVSDFNCSSHQLEHTTPSKQTPKRGRRKGTPLKKKATYMTPLKKKLSRKRKATPEEWEKNKRQRRRLSGIEYTSQRGKAVPARAVKPTNCTRCKYKCNIKVSDDERQNIFKTFWTLNSYQRKKDFIISHVGEKKTTKKYIFDEILNEPVPVAKRKRDIYRSYSFEVNGDKKKLFARNFSCIH